MKTKQNLIMVDYLNDFRNSSYAEMISRQIRETALQQDTAFMEICGGHTITIHKYGIRGFLPPAIKLVSGPGCPVCVTANAYIDKAIAIAAQEDVILCTFGDMIRVPGSVSSLAQAKAQGCVIKICLSAAEAVQTAIAAQDKQVVFLGIGFETTAPTIAASVKMAAEQKLVNFSVLSALKTMPAALEALIGTEEFHVQGFICPGHVSVITGTTIYAEITAKHRIPCVVAGFEPLDILQAIYMLAAQAARGSAETEIQYTRAVTTCGNRIAQQLMEEILEPCDAWWRGLGLIPGSGLRIRDEYRAFDADRSFTVQLPEARENPACLCGAIMRGIKTPPDCPLFASHCTPAAPVGACMVSSEGTCAVYYQYNRGGSL